MQHYSLEEWADFSRNVAGDAKKVAMQSHLETGCSKCSKVYTLWRRVNLTALREDTYAPPDAAVRTIKGLGAIHGIARHPKASTRLATLLFDSFANPIQAGVRSGAATAHQLLYGAGSYRIDVRIEPQTDSEKVAIVGQVLNAVDLAGQDLSVPVILLKGQKILFVSQTNSFGEFHIECKLHTDLKLHFRIPNEMEVWVPLVSPTTEAGSKPAGSSVARKLAGRVRKSTKGKS